MRSSECCHYFIETIFVCHIFQILEAMNEESGIPLKSLQVDGGMTANNLLMQLQADLMGINVGSYFIAPHPRLLKKKVEFH